MPRTPVKIRCFGRGLSENLKKLAWFFLLHPVSFYGQYYEKQKRPETIYQSFFGFQNMFRKILFLMINHVYFDGLVQSGFWVISKNKYANLCKPIHRVVIIPVLSDALNLKTVERKGRKLQKIEYLENEKSFLYEIKIIFHNFGNVFFWYNIKIEDTSLNISCLIALFFWLILVLQPGIHCYIFIMDLTHEKIKLQKARGNCIRFSLNLPWRSRINPSHFRKTNGSQLITE